MSDSASERNGPATDAVRADSRHVAALPSTSGPLCTDVCNTPGCYAVCALPKGHHASERSRWCACCVHASIAEASAHIAAEPSTKGVPPCGLQCDAPGCGKPCVRAPHGAGALDWCADHAWSRRAAPQVPVTPADFDRARQDAAAAAPDLVSRVQKLEAELHAANETEGAARRGLARIAKELELVERQRDELRAAHPAVSSDAELGRRVRAILGNPGCALHLLAVDRAPMVTLETKWGELAFENESLDDGIEMAEQAAALRAPKRTPAGAQ